MRKGRGLLFGQITRSSGNGGDDDESGRGVVLGGVFAKDKDNDMEQFSVDEATSRFSISGDILPSLGATGRTNRKINLQPFVVSPFDPRYRVWETFLVFLVFYTAWVSPFEFGFLDQPGYGLDVADNTVNSLFAVDIALTFFVAYLDKATYLLIDDRRLIAWKYLKTWFLFDLISTVPSELVRSILPDNLQSYGYFSMLRLWRLRRVSKFFARLEKDKNYSYFWVRCTKLICVTLFVVHMAGCFFYRLAATYSDPKKTWIGSVWGNFHEEQLSVRYVTSLYWSITTLTTTGYGDLHAVNPREMVFVMICMMFDLGLTAYLIGNMTNLVTHATGRTRNFRDTIQAALSFAQRNQLPVRLQDQIIAHLSLKYRTGVEGLHQQEAIEALPKAIQSSIANYLFYSMVDKVYLFRGVSNDLLFQLVSEMKAEYYPPREDVILQNEAPTDLYILVTGAVELITTKNGIEQVVSEAKSGDVVGELGVLCYRPQLFTVRTKRLSQLLRLNRTSFLSIVQANVGDGTVIINNLLQHLKEFRFPGMEGILTDTEQMVARGRMDLPLTLCFAAMRGDDLLLHQLLKRDADPNEADSNGRTALHIAAANGHSHCVVLLLEFEADPNCKDSEGNVPLWEALLGNHKAVIKLLADNGATLNSGDVGQFALAAAEQNNLDLLKAIVDHGGDVTVPALCGSTALHTAVSEGNPETVKFLLDQGADPDLPDVYGWTARALADHQGHEEIQALFQARQESKRPRIAMMSKHPLGVLPPPAGKPLSRYSSEPVVPPYSSSSSFGAMDPTPEIMWSDGRRRRRLNTYRNSLFGMMSAASTTVPKSPAKGPVECIPSLSYAVRVTISCLGRSEVGAKLIQLPKTMQELLDVGARKFGFFPTRVLSQEGAEIEDIELIRDGDHLVLVRDDTDGTS